MFAIASAGRKKVASNCFGSSCCLWAQLNRHRAYPPLRSASVQKEGLQKTASAQKEGLQKTGTPKLLGEPERGVFFRHFVGIFLTKKVQSTLRPLVPPRVLARGVCVATAGVASGVGKLSRSCCGMASTLRARPLVPPRVLARGVCVAKAGVASIACASMVSVESTFG